MEGQAKRMPILFIGHGSPMNAIETNEFTKNWTEIAKRIPRPEAILAISAHWFTDGTRIQDDEYPKVIYDMYGFPDELYRMEYKPSGAPALAHLTKDLIHEEVQIDNSWGIDHGAWSVLCHMYPEANIPLYQLSVDQSAEAQTHFELGKQIRSLREQGVLIIASGNVVHNLSKINWNMQGGYAWAEEFDEYIKQKIIKRQYEDVIHYKMAGKCSELAFYTPEHFYPLLYILGASDEKDKLSIYNDDCIMGSLSMTCYLFEQ
ncbi:4,5-DOPA dioxygenase extradiol [Clostridium aminobutyricum]|uniref:4,5-DOPA dioxygenase extradiol n=1 Tax=Clostridium aminobutyricum TaxID=33953 RepID=A0A939IGD6_CLOAM|nr:4,5-DOPA dioxygenase extradiol [Clostridium aminobutyricum]MBN7771762.1 4,5-DOPA dioxygenase extradiol [Clostridium aminobutyricum]